MRSRGTSAIEWGRAPASAPGAAPRPSPPRPFASFRSAHARVATIVSAALLAVGVLLRLFFYADRRSLWLDEIWVALNIVGRSFLGLTRPLDYAQSAPVGFLWVERLAVLLGGVNELALRAFPMLTGCLLLGALWMLARRLLDVRGAALALGLAAVSPLLLYFSNEVKPYGSDALVTVVLTWLALDVLDAPESPWAWRRLLGGGLIGMLVSTPAAFVLAGIGLALVAHPVIRGSRAGWMRLAGTGAAWLLLFVVGYLTVYRGTANSEYMQTIWRNDFLSLPLRTLASKVHRIARHMWIESFFGDQRLLPPKTIWTIAVLSLVGVISLVRRHSASAALVVVLPIVAVAGASFAHLWPLIPRLLVFLIPTFILLFVVGLWTAANLLPARARGLALASGALFWVPGAVFDARTVAEPTRRDDAGPLIREFSALPKESTIVYVVGHATPTWLFYSTDWDDRESEAFRFAAARANTPSHFETRACLQQEPGLRVVFGPTGSGFKDDSTLAREATWLAAQPERDVWVLTISYEHEAGHVMDEHMQGQDARLVAEQSREGAELRAYQFPGDNAPRRAPPCEERSEQNRRRRGQIRVRSVRLIAAASGPGPLSAS